MLSIFLRTYFCARNEKGECQRQMSRSVVAEELRKHKLDWDVRINESRSDSM